MTPEQIYQKRYSEEHREHLKEYRKRWREEHKGQIKEYKQRYLAANLEKCRASIRECGRRKWQRSGSGVHMARIQDWRDYFDGLASDDERCIAAYTLSVFAGAGDATANAIYRDPSFDYNHIAEHFAI